MLHRVVSRGFCKYLNEADISKLARPIHKKRVTESFRSRLDRRSKGYEDKVFDMDFGQMTQQLKEGAIDSAPFQVDQINRQTLSIEKQTRAELLGVRGRKADQINQKAAQRVESLKTQAAKLIGENTPDSLHHPWVFFEPKEEVKPRPEANLKSVFPFESLVTLDMLKNLFRSFVKFWASRDFDLLEDYCEPYLLKSLKKEMGLLPPRYKFATPNIRTCDMAFDLYEVKNVYMSCVNINRKRADSVNNYYRQKGSINGAEVEFLNKKRPGDEDQCGLIMQFSFNVFTDLLVTVHDEQGNLVMDDLGSKLLSQGKDPKAFPIDFKLELLAVQGKYKALKSLNYKGFNEGQGDEPFTNHMSKRNFRIIDINNFMSGNPLLVGLNWFAADAESEFRAPKGFEVDLTSQQQP